MKQAAVLIALVGSAVAQINSTCINIKIDGPTDTLSAECMPKDQSGYVPTELDLGDCFGWNGTDITPTRGGDGNFDPSCSGCHLFIAADPWYGFDTNWIGCTCDGEEAAAPLEDAFAHQYVTNDDGQLHC